MVDLDLQDDVIEVGQVQIDEQDVQVEDEDIDERLEDTLDDLAILGAGEVVLMAMVINTKTRCPPIITRMILMCSTMAFKRMML